MIKRNNFSITLKKSYMPKLFHFFITLQAILPDSPFSLIVCKNGLEIKSTLEIASLTAHIKCDENAFNQNWGFTYTIRNI